MASSRSIWPGEAELHGAVVDQAALHGLANGTPPGHGHRHTDELVPAWAGVLGLDPTADHSRVVAATAAAYRPV